jgi:hypothetical protein
MTYLNRRSRGAATPEKARNHARVLGRQRAYTMLAAHEISIAKPIGLGPLPGSDHLSSFPRLR